MYNPQFHGAEENEFHPCDSGVQISRVYKIEKELAKLECLVVQVTLNSSRSDLIVNQGRTYIL